MFILPLVTFSHNSMISLPPATEADASLNLQITKSDIASTKQIKISTNYLIFIISNRKFTLKLSIFYN